MSAAPGEVRGTRIASSHPPPPVDPGGHRLGAKWRDPPTVALRCAGSPRRVPPLPLWPLVLARRFVEVQIPPAAMTSWSLPGVSPRYQELTQIENQYQCDFCTQARPGDARRRLCVGACVGANTADWLDMRSIRSCCGAIGTAVSLGTSWSGGDRPLWPRRRGPWPSCSSRGPRRSAPARAKAPRASKRRRAQEEEAELPTIVLPTRRAARCTSSSILQGRWSFRLRRWRRARL